MSSRARAFIGVLTTVFFVATGASLALEGQTALGAVLVGLGVLRGLYAAAQIRDLRRPDDD